MKMEDSVLNRILLNCWPSTFMWYLTTPSICRISVASVFCTGRNGITPKITFIGMSEGWGGGVQNKDFAMKNFVRKGFVSKQRSVKFAPDIRRSSYLTLWPWLSTASKEGVFGYTFFHLKIIILFPPTTLPKSFSMLFYYTLYEWMSMERW